MNAALPHVREQLAILEAAATVAEDAKAELEARMYIASLQGLSFRQIAGAANVSHETVRRVVHKFLYH